MNQYFIVYDWMTGQKPGQLGLTWPEAYVYAVVYSFSKAGRGDFHASIASLAALVGCSTSGARRTLHKLCEKGLAVCTNPSKGGGTGHYVAVVPQGVDPGCGPGFSTPETGTDPGCGPGLPLQPARVNTGCQPANNKYNNKIDNKEKTQKRKTQKASSLNKRYPTHAALTPIPPKTALAEPDWCQPAYISYNREAM